MNEEMTDRQSILGVAGISLMVIAVIVTLSVAQKIK